MHIPTHILSGWIGGNFVPSFGARERFFCMVAAVAPDLDGLSLLGGWECYYDWHHVLMHNLPFALAFSLLLAYFSKPRFTAFAVYFGLLHLHFLMDLLGSGDNWQIEYFRPFSAKPFFSFGWDFLSWQNYLAAFLCIAATVGIIYWKKRTILEYPMPKLDRELTEFFLKLAGGRRFRGR